jgi:hypothetical protein
MSAKQAAAALVEFDTELKARVEEVNARGSYWWIDAANEADVKAIIKDTAGTWTLSLAAAAAGVTEEAVLVAMYRNHLHGGTQVAALGRVRSILSGEEAIC